MSAVTMALALRRLREQSPILELMRQETMPIVAAELAAHLGGEDRSLSAAELYELIDERIARTRAGDFEPAGPRAAVARLMDVMRDARDVLTDFARVRESMALNRRLRQDLIEDDSP